MHKLRLFMTFMLLTSILFLTSGCSKPTEEGSPFSLEMMPEQLNGDSIPGQRCVFLVTITDESPTGENPVELSAEASNADIIIYKHAITEEQVAEIVAIPRKSSVGETVKLTVSGSRNGFTDQKSVTFQVIDGEDDRQKYASELRDKFAVWLEANHPELGITYGMEWAGTMVSPQWLVVSHYLFFSDEWEMHVEWHIMIPPHDWARIDLRHRFDESKPSSAFEISSLDAGSDPIAIEVPETVWR
ncbi:hypothetical protein [Anaerobium acetethylicum]|uniref:Lipoprotein n=1 Tax=Anaerobium acetethylicum TaxID=1619234 RepID=A0A1D3TNN7_9FIRM|nr:hypothetical protein [Anaerobium acetethylicum]SCP94955.1 hypothetical protein SAMN05421730_1001189 [Anaerobium acetethylicum]